MQQGRNRRENLDATSAMVGKICPPGGDMVKAFENLGATEVAPVAPVDASLCSVMQSENSFSHDLVCPFI